VRDEDDRLAWLEVLAKVVERYRLVCYAYCLLRNHFHLLVETPRANLGSAMQRLCSVHALAFNRRHHRVGHLFQGRYKAIVVERDAHLLELARYLALNPVRAGLCSLPEDWHWSSYAATIGARPAPGFLAVAQLLELFGSEPGLARRRLVRFVSDGVEADPFGDLKGGLYLGSDEFARSLSPRGPERDVARAEWQPVRPSLASLLKSRDDAGIALAHREHGYTLVAIADHLGLHRTTVGRRLQRCERQEMHQRTL
jgi:REP element-mobilizing transposase RayT